MDNQHLNHSNQSGLAAFKASLFFKIIDWCLIYSMVFLCITVDTLAYSTSVRAAELPPNIELTQLIQIGSSTQTSVKRITRSDFDFTYTLNISYIGNIPLQQVKGHLISLSPSTQIIDADIDFGNLMPGQTLTGKDTYTIRQDRSKPFDPSGLKWSFTYNHPPVANAGSDQSVPVGAEVLLDGAGSTDADGDPLTYRWTFTARPNSSVAALDNLASPKPRFTVDRAGRYILSLIVNDGNQDSTAGTVIIDTENSKPIADAGPDQTVATGDTVYLNGSASRDPDGDALQYTWTLEESPGNQAELNFADSANPFFTATKAGRYVVRLAVSDGKLDSEADLVIVSTRNSAPVADAGPDQNITLGDPALTLHGGNSSDADGQTLSYRWAILHAPDGSSAGIDPFNTVEPGFKPDRAGLYVVQLIVNDGELDSAPDTAQINAASPPPPPNQAPKITTSPRTTGTVGQLYSYDVDATDPDISDILGYSLQVSGPGMLIDSVSGLISWMPTEAGNFEITAKVQDKGGLSDTQNYTLKISAAPPVNRAPQITSTPVTNATAGQLYSYDVEATDPDGDTLTYALTQSPEGMTIDNNTGLIQWTPPGINAQPAAVIVRVTDTGGLPAEQSFTITVNLPNNLPVAQDDSFEVDLINPITIAASGVLGNDSDADNDPLTAILQTQPANGLVDLKPDGGFTYAPNVLPPGEPLQVKLKWAWTSSTTLPDSLNVLNSPAIIDLNGDGTPDIVFGSTTSRGGANVEVGQLRAIDGKTGGELFTVTNRNINVASSVAVGDIDGDGKPEIVACDATGDRLVTFEHDGTFKWQSPQLEQVNWGSPSLADLDQDGVPEIIIGRQVLNSDGTLRWTGTGGRAYISGPLSLVSDIDLDGHLDIVAGNTVYSFDGQIEWQNNIPDGFNAVGNFDTDPQAEVVLVSSGSVYLFNYDGTFIWGPVAIPGGGQGGPPTIADFDGDGQPEIGVAGARRYVVFETDGSIKWQAVTQDASSNVTGSSVFDFEGDGAAEVVYRDELKLRVYKGSDGTVLFETPMSSCTWYEYPLVADVDNDGHAEIVVGANNNCSLGPQRGIYVFADQNNRWVATRKIWNQHSYHITNVNEDGTIPRQEAANWLLPGLNNFRLNSFGPRDTARTDSFTYKASDGKGESNPATVTLTAKRPNQSPIITTTPVTSGKVGEAYSYDVDAFDPDPQDTLTFALGQHPDGMSINQATGLISWTPADAQTGNHNVTVSVADSGGLSQIQTFMVTVTLATPPNRVPVAQDETFRTAGTVLQQSAPGVLANDSDPDGDMIIALLFSGSANGTVNLSPDGSFTYTPNAGFVGTDTFTYKASDGKLDSNLATVTITVTEANQPPVITSTPNISQWVQLNPEGTPPTPRHNYVGGNNAYDWINDRLIMFGGSDNYNETPPYLNDVWVLENATATKGTPRWIKLEPQGSAPAGRVLHSVVYDPTANRLIVYGGLSQNDTWVLTNANGIGGTPEWIRLPDGDMRNGHAMGHDPVSNRLIVFGGALGANGPVSNDVKVLVDANGIGNPSWIMLSPIGTAPTPRGNPSAVYDPLSNRLIIFGGRKSLANNELFNDVWVLTNANGLGGTPEWKRIDPIGPLPPARLAHVLGFDPNSNRLIIYGGISMDETSSGTDTWVLTHANGSGGTSQWIKLLPQGAFPPQKWSFWVGYSGTANAMAVVGGATSGASLTNDVWVLRNASGNCTANQPCDYDVDASDADAGEVLSYALVQGPAGMTIEAGTGQLHWTPGAAQTGTNDVSVKVTDAGGLSATQSFQLTVAPVAVPNVQGLAPEWAEAMLQAAGLNTGAKSSLGGAITLNFDTLPSEQGWTFDAGPAADENTWFSVSGGTLLQNTLGMGGLVAYFKVASGVDARLPFSIDVHARVTAEEGGVSTNHAGFGFAAWPANSIFVVGLGTDAIELSANTPPFLRLFATFDNTAFHDYLLSARPGIDSVLKVDGSLLLSGPSRVYPNPYYALVLGDLTGGPNAQAEVTAYSFTQPQITTQTPAPGTLVNPASAVDLGIQEGPATQTVPAVLGQTQADAQTDIGTAGLLVGNVTTEASNIIPAGKVIRQKPMAGTHIMKNFKVDLVLSSGPGGVGACVAPPTGLVAWWSGDATAQDYISANHGSAMNGADYAVGLVGSGFKLDGVDDHVRIPNSATLQTTGPFTVEFWFKPGIDFTPLESTGKNHYFFAKGAYNLPSGFVSTYGINTANNDGRIEVNMPLPRPSSIRNTWDQGLWYHAAATWDGTNYRLFIDGQEEGSSFNSLSILNNTADIFLGWENNQFAHTPFNGVLDEVSVYQRALTFVEIQSIYNAGDFGKCKDGIVVADAGSDRTANTGDTVTLNGTTSRALDGKPITYSWSLIQKPADSFAEFDSPTSVTSSFVPDVAGDYVAQLVVSNDVKTSAPDTLKITVSGSSVNHPPRITSTPVTTANTGELYRYDVNATDPDAGDVLSYSLTTAPAGMSIDTATGLIQWTPVPAQVGNQSVIVKVQDQGGLSVTQGFTIAVSQTNHAPSISSTPPAGGKADKLYSYAVIATDPDVGDALTYSFATNVPAGMSIDAATGLLQWTPTAAQVGTHSGIIVKVSDQKGLFTTQSIDITVKPANRAPSIGSSAPTVATENEPYIYAVQASDPDAGDTLSYSLPTAPDGMTINQNTGLISWTPASSQIGEHPVTVRVQDQDGSWVTQSYTVTVEIASVIVPDVEGATLDNAQAALTASQLRPGNVLYLYDEIVPAGIVLSQLPLAGASVAKNTAVDLIVSQGPAPVSVPSVVGFTQAAAESALLAAKLTVGTVTPAESDTIPNGIVISQAPTASTPVPKNTPVDLVVSSGPALVDTPNVISLDEASAEAALLAVNLVVGTKSSVNSETVPAGQVISQNPAAGVKLAKGSAVDLVVSIGPSAPEFAAIQVLPESSLLLTGDTLTFSALAILDDGTSQSLSGATWTSATPSVATVNASGVVTALAEGQTLISAKKGGVTGSITLTVKAAVPGDVTPPNAAITAPVGDATITAPTAIIGTASDANLLKYELSLSPVGQNQFTVFKTGDTAVTNSVLGTLDPTLLLNDQYTLRLTVWDRRNNQAQSELRVQVAREQKVGNFMLAFQDVSVPMACMPITVTRVYDSRDKRKGDFGIGWRLDVKTMQLRESREMGSGWHVDLINKKIGFITIPVYVLSSDDVHKVSLTLPDGQVEEFDLTVSPTQNNLYPIDTVNLAYSPRPGTLGSLAPVAPTEWGLSGEQGTVEFIDSDVNIFDPQQYRYTAPDGSVYIIDKHTGVQSVQCINGQSLSFNANGISHSDGAGVAFTRDGQNRITAIADPMGNNHQYSYDSNGDLIQHSDPANQKTGFKYDYRHGLIEIDDPRGIKAVRNEYDADGRLIGNTDAASKKITYNHDLVAKKETVTDRLGNSTAYEYDDKGNVLKQTDALGNETIYTYDAAGNQLTKTDALGRTTTQDYDSRRNVLRETDPLGHVTRYTYHALNGVKTIQDPLGHVTTNDYDANGNLLSTADPLGNVTTYSYDKGGIIYPGSGLMTSKTDALGNKTRYNYDAQGRMTTETDPQGHATTYEYDANGNRIRETRTRNGGTETLVTTFEYDSLNRLVKTIQPDGSTSQTVYNAIGKQAQTVDALGRATQYEYDALGHLIKTTYPDGAFETSGYDAEGRRIESIDRAGRKTIYTYDALGRLTLTTYADGTTNSTVYDQAGQVTASVDALGHVTSYTYDDAGRRTQVTDALGHVTQFVYDAADNQSQVIDANGHATAFVYDNGNRCTAVLYPDGSQDQTGYDALGRNTGKTDQAGKLTQFAYDALGRLITVTDALGQITTYGYDERGNQLSQTDANGHTTTFAYDGMGRRISRTLPEGQTEHMAYNAAGNLISKTDFNGKTTTYAYDVLNRLITKIPDASLGEPAVTYDYTVTGQRAVMQDASGVNTYSYDTRDRLIEKATPQGILTYTYNGAGQLAGIRSNHAGGVDLSYSYDTLNRLAKVTDQGLGNADTTYSYDNAGSLAGYVYPNGVETAYTYTALNRLTDMHVAKAGADLARYQYTLGATGNRLSVAELSGRTVSYAYDDLYRLTRETISGVATPGQNGEIAYTYDPVGNRLTRTSTVAGIANQAFTYNANDQLSTDAYDANGNTIGTDGKTYAYDGDNRLTSQNGVEVQIFYDGDGNRVAKTVGGVTTQYLVDTLNPTGYAQVLEEIENGSVVLRYSYGSDLISQSLKVGPDWQTYFYGYDGHGSVRFLTDGSGNVTDRYDYEGFGNLVNQEGTTANSYLYSGEQRDKSLGLDYLRARWMKAESGRFQTMDPFNGTRHIPMTLQKYIYANNNPIQFLDPSGQLTLTETMSSVAIVGVLTSVAPGVLNMQRRNNGQRGRYLPNAVSYGISVTATTNLVGMLVGLGSTPALFVPGIATEVLSAMQSVAGTIPIGVGGTIGLEIIARADPPFELFSIAYAGYQLGCCDQGLGSASISIYQSVIWDVDSPGEYASGWSAFAQANGPLGGFAGFLVGGFKGDGYHGIIYGLTINYPPSGDFNGWVGATNVVRSRDMGHGLDKVDRYLLGAFGVNGALLRLKARGYL